MSKNKKPATLGEMLPEPHYTKFLEMVREHNGNMVAVTDALHKYLKPFAAEFKARGHKVDDVAYTVPRCFQQALQQQQMQQQADQAHESLAVANEIVREKSNPWN